MGLGRRRDTFARECRGLISAFWSDVASRNPLRPLPNGRFTFTQGARNHLWVVMCQAIYGHRGCIQFEDSRQ